MSGPNSASKLRTIALIYRHRILYNSAVSNPLYTHQRHRFLNNFSTSHTANGRFYKVPESTNILKDDKDTHQKRPTAPPRPIFSSWVKWLFGSILSVFIPYYCKQKWDNFLLIEGKAEKIVEEVETVAEVVEKVADTAEKLSTNMADKLSDDTKLKEAALMVEGLSTVIEKDAQLTADFLHKVGDIKEDLKELKTIVEPLTHTNKSTHVEHDGNKQTYKNKSTHVEHDGN